MMLSWVELSWVVKRSWGPELSWIEWNGVELSWIEWYGVELSWIELSWVELNWVELSLNWVWIELNWVELSWIELNWIELSLNWVEFDDNKLWRIMNTLELTNISESESSGFWSRVVRLFLELCCRKTLRCFTWRAFPFLSRTDSFCWAFCFSFRVFWF